MLDGRYPSEEFAELRPRIVWDRVEDTIRARKGALQLAVTNAGTIPDRGLYGVHLPDGRRVGELDEEMVYEARPGQTFLLGASTWRIEEITRDRVIVTPAPGAPGAVPFWKGDGIGRPEGAGRGDRRVRRARPSTASPPSWPGEYDLDERAARNLSAFLREQRDATRVVPTDRTIVIERFRDEIGDWRLCVLSPFGGRVHAAWALALSARIRDEFGLESDAIWSDDGIIVHLPDADEPPAADLVLVEPDELEELVVRELSGSALFGARFRENAARALLLPRACPGKRTPLWQQRLKAQSLLEVAKRYGQFPIVLETYRECLRDVLDLPGLEALLRGLHTRELSLVEVETQRASPFASSLLFDYVATYMYEGDTPNAERRAAALSLDRDLLRELLGQEELRDLIDPAALDEVEADLQRTSERTQRRERGRRCTTCCARVGDLTADEAQARCLPAVSAQRMLGELEKRAARGADADRRRGALDRGRGRRPLPRRARRRAAGRAARGLPRGGRGAARAADPPLRAHPRAVHDAGGVRPLRGRPRRRCCASSSARATWSAASCARAAAGASGATPRCCAACAAPRSRRCARRSSPPSSARWRASCRPGRAWTRRRRRRRRPPARGARAAAGRGAGAGGVGARRAAAPARVATRRPGSTSSARAASSSGSARARSGAAPAGWRSTSARTPAGSARRRSRASRPAEPLHDALRERLGRRRGVLDRPARRPRRGRAGRAPGGALGPGLGGRGDQRRLRAAARAAADAGARSSATPAGASRAAGARAPRRCRGAGR